MSFDKENDAPFADISFTSSDGGTCPKKRPRQFSDACDPNVDEEGRCKTRRVDPDRLAERLPLELVAEMDACIFPGAKMPVFGIRKAMQEKYNVDRRNIYDYFHSRGLRVSKEDKHQNLVRSRKAAAAKASASPPSATAKASSADPAKRRKLVHRPSVRHYTSTPSLSGSRLTTSTCVKKESPSVTTSSRLSSSFAAPVLSENHNNSCSENVDLRIRPSTTEPVLVDNYSGHSAEPVIFDIALPFDKYGRYMDDESPLAPYDDTAAQDFDLSTMSTLFDADIDQSSIDYACLSLEPTADSAASVTLTGTTEPDNHPSLSKEERHNIYNLISNAIGPARGMQECLGSYKAYMDERTRVYNEKLCLSSQSFVSSANILSVSQTPVSPTLSKAPCDIRSPVPPPVTTPSFPYSPSPPPFLSSHSISSGPLLLAPSPIISRQCPSPAQTLQRDRIFQHPLPHLEPAGDCFSSNAALHWT